MLFLKSKPKKSCLNCIFCTKVFTNNNYRALSSLARNEIGTIPPPSWTLSCFHEMWSEGQNNFQKSTLFDKKCKKYLQNTEDRRNSTFSALSKLQKEKIERSNRRWNNFLVIVGIVVGIIGVVVGIIAIVVGIITTLLY